MLRVLTSIFVGCPGGLLGGHEIHYIAYERERLWQIKGGVFCLLVLREGGTGMVLKKTWSVCEYPRAAITEKYKLGSLAEPLKSRRWHSQFLLGL